MSVTLNTMTTNRLKLSENDRDQLIHAVESATKIRRQEDFRTWIGREFHALFPHERLVCIEVDHQGNSHLVECLDHNLADSRDHECHHPHAYDLSLRLLRAMPHLSPMSWLLDAEHINTVLAAEHHPAADATWEVKNAFVHRIEFLSGARYFLVLFNTPEDHAPRGQHLFKLLSSHVKMALSWKISHSEAIKRSPLTARELEILNRMREGKSNREISAQLGINPLTLKSHVAKIYRKLDVRTRDDAVSHRLHACNLIP